MEYYSQMSDSQLKQTISRLQSSAGATPRFPTWQNQPTPQAGTSWQNKDKKTRTRPTRTGTATPVAIAAAPGVYQQTGPPLYTQIPSIPPPVPTYTTLLPSTTQALHTSYPSRLRTGATLLVQPILVSQSIANKAGRAAKRINYAEAASGDEDMEVDVGGKEIDSEDSDFIASGGVRASIRREGSRALGSHQPFQQAVKGPLDQSYLGSIPPSRFLSSKLAQQTKHDYVTPDVLLEQARKPSTLIPIRVELETDTHRIRDAFVWNLNEQIISPAAFARIFCADLDLPSIPYAEQVEGAIRSQIEEWESVASVDLRPPLPQPSLEDPVPFYSVTNELLLIDEPKLDEWNPDLLGEEYQDGEGEEVPDCRVILEIDVQIATQHLLDHIEWDLVSPLTPEHFARTLCTDLGLSGESVPLIAHAIHEEILRHKRDAIEWGVIHTGDALTAEEEDRDRPRDRSGMSLLKDKTGLGMGMGFGRRGEGKGPRSLRGVFRDWSEMEDWGTSLEELTAEEVERREIERERAARYGKFGARFPVIQANGVLHRRLRRETSRFQQTAVTARRRR